MACRTISPDASPLAEDGLERGLTPDDAWNSVEQRMRVVVRAEPHAQVHVPAAGGQGGAVGQGAAVINQSHCHQPDSRSLSVGLLLDISQTRIGQSQLDNSRKYAAHRDIGTRVRRLLEDYWSGKIVLEFLVWSEGEVGTFTFQSEGLNHSSRFIKT